MDLGDGRNRGRRGNINMNNRKQLRQDRATMATFSEQLVALDRMTVGELAEKFREVFGFPTRTRNKPYLRKRLAWQIQALAEGGLSPRALAKIEELAPLAPVRWRPRHDRLCRRAHPGTTTRFATASHRLDRRAGPPGRRASGHRPR